LVDHNPPEYTFERRDTHTLMHHKDLQREYDHYLHIIKIAKEHNYDAKIAELSPF
jgi:hypothetical protein